MPEWMRQTAVADHFVIRTSIRAEAQGQPPVPRAPTISRHHCLEATDQIATSNYWDVLADGAADDTDTDIHQLTSQFLESANAVADNLSLRLSPPVTRSNRRLLSGTNKRAILASNTARQASLPLQLIPTLTQSSATLYEMSDGRTDLVFSAAGHVWKQFPVVLQSLHCTTRWHSTVRPNIDPACHARNSDILDQDFSWNQIASALLQMSPRKAPGDDVRFINNSSCMLCASIVSIDKKDGDPLNPGDKRGIALINVGLKLVCKVLQMRIERFVETNNLLSYEQAGFRSAKSVLDK
ncbi:hypothetical protein BASA83_007030 [Batrachochytrium salamandrivorans]|nr:hypothetical protein BASA83_007030 [Batrachochytrium salamandrivorans]